MVGGAARDGAFAFAPAIRCARACLCCPARFPSAMMRIAEKPFNFSTHNSGQPRRADGSVFAKSAPEWEDSPIMPRHSELVRHKMRIVHRAIHQLRQSDKREDHLRVMRYLEMYLAHLQRTTAARPSKFLQT
jgi:hypothetical protein